MRIPTKKGKMHALLTEVEILIRFLNQDLGFLAKEVAKQEAEEARRRQFFMNRVSNLRTPQPRVVYLGELKSDQLTTTRHDADALAEFQAWLKLTLATVLKEDAPPKALYHLLNGINRRIHKKPIFLTGELCTAKVLPRKKVVRQNLRLGGCSYSFKIVNSEGDYISHICYLVLRVLGDQQQVDQLGICRTCRKFFSKVRRWQQDCNKKCKNRHAAKRGKTASKMRKAAREAVQRFDVFKHVVTTLLGAKEFIKKLGFSPSERYRIAERLLSDLRRATSEAEFWRAAGEFRRIIKAGLEDLAVSRRRSA